MKLHQSLSARTSRQSVSDRERQAWRLATAKCHGVSALLVDLPVHLATMPSTRPLNKHLISTACFAARQSAVSAIIDPYAWPFVPQTFDAVWLSWAPLTARCQPRVLTEIDSCLADDGRVLVYVDQAHLAQWCWSGMAQSQALGWQLQQQHWGDARRFSLMPALIAQQWAAPWQRYFPMAQWCVQLWQKTNCRLTPISDNSAINRGAWSNAWPAQQRQRNNRNLHE